MATEQKATPFANLATAQYAALTTFRKSGIEVTTPIWFVDHNGIIYFRTQQQTGKVKRIRHTPRVTLAPCTAGGKTTGERVEGRARIINYQDEAELARQLLKRKYGLRGALFNGGMHLVRALLRKRPPIMIYLAVEHASDD